MTLTLKPEPITADAFAPFGKLLTRPSASGRMDYSDTLMNLRSDAAVCFRTSLTEPTALPLTTRTMERHEFSSQAFLPVDVGRYLVMVAPHDADGGPDVDGLRLFEVDGGTGISYDANVWHHPMTVLDKPATFATVMFLDGGAGDEQFLELPVEVEIRL